MFSELKESSEPRKMYQWEAMKTVLFVMLDNLAWMNDAHMGLQCPVVCVCNSLKPGSHAITYRKLAYTDIIVE